MATSAARRQPWYGERELRYLRDYLEGLLDYSTARAPTRREAGFRAWMMEGRDNWMREDFTGALTLERPMARNGKRPQLKESPITAPQLKLFGEDAT